MTNAPSVRRCGEGPCSAAVSQEGRATAGRTGSRAGEQADKEEKQRLTHGGEAPPHQLGQHELVDLQRGRAGGPW